MSTSAGFWFELKEPFSLEILEEILGELPEIVPAQRLRRDDELEGGEEEEFFAGEESEEKEDENEESECKCEEEEEEEVTEEEEEEEGEAEDEDEEAGMISIDLCRITPSQKHLVEEWTQKHCPDVELKPWPLRISEPAAMPFQISEFPQACFFYATLLDPAVRNRVMRIDSEADARQIVPALLHGHTVKDFRGLKMLIEENDGGIETGSVVSGGIFEVHSQAEVDLLRFYETSFYELARCSCTLVSGDRWENVVTFKATAKTLQDIEK